MEWFFALDDNSAGWFRDMVKVAVVSARDNTSLSPNCVFDGSPNDLTRWLERNGVKMHYYSVPFKEELFSERVLKMNEGSVYSPQHACGTFLKICLQKFASGTHFLQTDCDVMFVGEVDVAPVETMAASIEHAAGGRNFNSGVMYINSQYYTSTFDEMVEFMRQNGFYDRKNSSYDQTLLNRFFSDRKWEDLRPEMNWRAFQGINDDARILHFHGPKPQWIKGKILSGSDSGLPFLTPLYESNPEAFAYYLGFFDSYLRRAAKM